MLSSDRSDWATPQAFFDKLDAEFHFTLDACATSENAKLPNFYSPEQDALKQDWRGAMFMNPPYGNPEFPCKSKCKKKRCAKRGHHVSQYVPGICDFVKKAWQSAQGGATVVCLLPARTDTAWWHDYCQRGEVRFLRGRLKFTCNGKTGPAPFPSVIVIFRPEACRPS